MENALGRGRIGPLQVQAAIAALHAQAKTPDETDWRQIVGLYDVLMRITPSPIVRLNQIVAVSMVFPLETALSMLDEVSDELDSYAPFWATRADVLRRLDRAPDAKAAYTKAITHTENAREAAHYRRRVRDLS